MNSSLTRSVAFIREAECIGCTRCIQVCPVNAIIGAPKLMHTVFSRLCTGCDLCLEPCPVDCIDMVQTQLPAPDETTVADKISDKANTETDALITRAAAQQEIAAAVTRVKMRRSSTQAKNHKQP